MPFSLIHYREIDGAYDSETSNTVAMYSPNIWFLGCSREIKITYLIPHFHLDGICFVSQPGNKLLPVHSWVEPRRGMIIIHFSLVLHQRAGSGGFSLPLILQPVRGTLHLWVHNTQSCCSTTHLQRLRSRASCQGAQVLCWIVWHAGKLIKDLCRCESQSLLYPYILSSNRRETKNPASWSIWFLGSLISCSSRKKTKTNITAGRVFSRLCWIAHQSL